MLPIIKRCYQWCRQSTRVVLKKSYWDCGVTSDEIKLCCVILTSPLLYRASLARTIFLYQKTFHLCRPEVFCAMKIQRCTYIQEVPTASFDLKIASIKFLYVHNIPTVANFWRINYNMLKKDKFICRLSVVIAFPRTRDAAQHM